jgi:TonB family protein
MPILVAADGSDPARPSSIRAWVYQSPANLDPPTVLVRVDPAYPELARAENMQGPVYVEGIIGRDGRVRDAKAVGGAPFPALRAAAVDAVRQWTYSVTTFNGQPVEVQVSVQVLFRLNTDAPTVRTIDTPVLPGVERTATVRANDVLAIDISGEDQLPRWYVVDQSGDIRLPFIGRLSVTDLTAEQLRDAIAQVLSKHKLAEGSTVKVRIQRPR